MLSVRPRHADDVLVRFQQRGIACAVVGEVQPQPQVTLRHAGRTAPLWDVATEAFITTGEQLSHGRSEDSCSPPRGAAAVLSGRGRT